MAPNVTSSSVPASDWRRLVSRRKTNAMMANAEMGSGSGPDFQSHWKARARKSRRRVALRGVLGFVGLFGIWQIASTYYNLTLVLPSPGTVVRDVIDTLLLRGNGWMYGANIYVHLGESLLRAVIGFVIAVAIAVPLGLAVGQSRALREIVRPPIMALYPIPGIAWVPLTILWFGLTNKAIVFVVIISVFFAVFFSTESGVRAISEITIDAGRCYGAKGLRLFWRVMLPATVPSIVTGLRLGLGDAWRMIVAAEMIAGVAGMGYIMTQARFFFRAPDLMTFMLLVSIVGYISERIIVGSIERWTIQRYSAVRD